MGWFRLLFDHTHVNRNCDLKSVQAACKVEYPDTLPNLTACESCPGTELILCPQRLEDTLVHYRCK